MLNCRTRSQRQSVASTSITLCGAIDSKKVVNASVVLETSCFYQLSIMYHTAVFGTTWVISCKCCNFAHIIF